MNEERDSYHIRTRLTVSEGNVLTIQRKHLRKKYEIIRKIMDTKVAENRWNIKGKAASPLKQCESGSSKKSDK